MLAADIRVTDQRADPDPHTNTHFAPRKFTTRKEWVEHRRDLRQQVLTSAGLWPRPARGAVPVRSFGELVRNGYVVEKLLIETLPGFHVGVNVYRPADGSKKRPGVLVAHGHWKHGRIEHTEAYSVPALCAGLAVNGYVALAYDMAGYGDTRQMPHKFGDSRQEQLWSFGPLALQLWNSMRVLDYLAARADVDDTRLAMTGASGGGTQTYLLAAVDSRIRVSIPAVMVSARFQGDDPCEMAPGLRVGTNNVELAAAMAPRPMLLLSTSRDWTSHVPTLEFPAIREIYGLFGWASRVESLHMDSEHGYNRTQRLAALEFLNRQFGLKSSLPEPNEFSEPPLEFLVGEHTAAQQQGAVDREGVFAAWQRMVSIRSQAMSSSQRRELLRELTGSRWPRQVLRIAVRGEQFLRLDADDVMIPSHWVDGAGTNPVLAVHAKGREQALGMKTVKESRERGERVLAIDLFGTRAADATDAVRHGDHLVFHYSDDANRVQDIVSAAAYLAAQGAKSVRLVCGAGTGEYCRLAAAVAPIDLHVELETPARERIFIPGLLAAGYDVPR